VGYLEAEYAGKDHAAEPGECGGHSLLCTHIIGLTGGTLDNPLRPSRN
jgi:hypothetical protein